LGIAIPPSIPLIIFGITALGIPAPPAAVEEIGQFQTVSIPKVFIAGFMPTSLIAGNLLLMKYGLAKKRGYKGPSEGWSARQIWRELYRGFWALMPRRLSWAVSILASLLPRELRLWRSSTR
jgi:C4-dicarboxylate transporter DctM subunit